MTYQGDEVDFGALESDEAKYREASFRRGYNQGFEAALNYLRFAGVAIPEGAETLAGDIEDWRNNLTREGRRTEPPRYPIERQEDEE